MFDETENEMQDQLFNTLFTVLEGIGHMTRRMERLSNDERLDEKWTGFIKSWTTRAEFLAHSITSARDVNKRWIGAVAMSIMLHYEMQSANVASINEDGVAIFDQTDHDIWNGVVKLCTTGAFLQYAQNARQFAEDSFE